jgi:hypothetical protein
MVKRGWLFAVTGKAAERSPHSNLWNRRTAIKHHPEYSESGYLRAVEAAFENWEAMQKASR